MVDHRPQQRCTGEAFTTSSTSILTNSCGYVDGVCYCDLDIWTFGHCEGRIKMWYLGVVLSGMSNTLPITSRETKSGFSGPCPFEQ